VQERAQLLERAAEKGEASNYEGWRVSTKGKRFRVKDVKLFNVADLSGDKIEAVMHRIGLRLIT
jgi:hypothetical protein